METRCCIVLFPKRFKKEIGRRYSRTAAMGKTGKKTLFFFNIMVFAMFRLWYGLVNFYSPYPNNNQLPKNSFINRTKVPISSSVMNFWDWVWSGTGLECNNNLVGLDNPSCPGRVNTSPKETNIIDSTSRMHAHRMADSLRHTKLLYSYLTKGMASAARPCQREAAEGRQSHAAESWQGVDATSMTPPCVSWTTAPC